MNNIKGRKRSSLKMLKDGSEINPNKWLKIQSKKSKKKKEMLNYEMEL